MVQYDLPNMRPGQTVGLLGGSFDPPHAGHLHISREALKRFGLDQVWWLVSPGNPLKTRGPAPLARRVQAARSLIDHPRIAVSDFEAKVGTRYTAETLEALQKAAPRQQFVWLMGADNLAQFHLWQDWEQIVNRVPIGVMARPGKRTQARTSKTARIYAGARLPGRMSQLLPQCQAPAWCFINLPMRAISSTELRQNGDWPAVGKS